MAKTVLQRLPSDWRLIPGHRYEWIDGTTPDWVTIEQALRHNHSLNAPNIAAFDALGDRVRHLHVQNRDADRTMTLLEDGDWTDYRRFLPHARAVGFDGALCIEFTAGIVPAEGEAFDLSGVLENAGLDRRFIERLWNA